MNDLIEISGVRGFVDNAGTVQLNLEDVARGLGFIQNKGNVEYVRWETVYSYLGTFGFSQQAGKEGFIPENIFYRLAMKAKNEAAEAFQVKVADEILPSIRKHGAYMTPEKLQEVLCSPDTIIKLATDLKQELERREHAEALIEAQKPKVLFAESVMASDKSILMNELAKIICQNGYDIGQNRLYGWMVNNGYLFYRDGGYLPSQRAMDLKAFEIKKTTIELPDREPIVRNTIEITPKGQIYFVNKFLAKKEAV